MGQSQQSARVYYHMGRASVSIESPFHSTERVLGSHIDLPVNYKLAQSSSKTLSI